MIPVHNKDDTLTVSNRLKRQRITEYILKTLESLDSNQSGFLLLKKTK